MQHSSESIQERLRLKSTERLKLDRLPRWVHLFGLGGTGLVFVLLLAVYTRFHDVAVWADWVPAREFTHPKYGERIYPDSVFRTRMNTWSNLVYVCFGFYAMALAIHDWRRKLPLERGYLMIAPAQTFVFGLTGLYLGFGSGFFHASLTRYGQQCDVGAMYATLLCLASFALGSWWPRISASPGRPTWPLWAGLVLAGSVYFTYYKSAYSFSEVSRYLFGVLFVFAGVNLVRPGKHLQIRWFLAALLALVLGANIRALDIADKFTGPDSWFQGHALWHVLSCLMYIFLFFYFRSEERGVESQK